MTTTPTPTYPQFTNLPLHDGLFDKLMAAVKHHLNIEWDAQRLRGDMYTKVYLGSMESVLTNSTQYLLGILLITERQNKLLAEIDLIVAQTDKVRKEIEYLEAKILTELANTDATIADTGSLIGKQISLLTAQRIGFAGDIKTKTAKLHSDYAAVYQSVQEVFDDVLLNVDAKAAITAADTLANTINALP